MNFELECGYQASNLYKLTLLDLPIYQRTAP
jgi:hypothetical protein